MRTKNFGYLMAISLASIALGLLFFNPVFLTLSISSISMIIIGFLKAPPNDDSIQIEREEEEIHTYEGEEFEVTLNIKNNSNSSVFIEVKDNIPENVKLLEGSNHRFFYLGSKEEKRFSYKIEFLKTENYEIGPVNIRALDPLKLYTREWKFNEFTNVVALPPTEDLSRTKLRPKRTQGWLGNIKSGQMGVGSEFFSIREYHQGDEMRDLNWKALARYLEPKTNSYEAEKSGDVIIILDAFRESNVGVFEDNLLKHSVKAATSLASDIISDRNRVGLLVIGNFVRWVYPRSGQEQIYKIMNNLMDLKSGSYWRLEHAKYILDEIFPSRCLIVFISPLYSDKVAEMIASLARDRYELAVVSPCPVELQKKHIDKEDKMAEKLQRIERQTRISRLRNFGPVVDWETDQPLEVAVEGVRRYQNRT